MAFEHFGNTVVAMMRCCCCCCDHSHLLRSPDHGTLSHNFYHISPELLIVPGEELLHDKFAHGKHDGRGGGAIGTSAQGEEKTTATTKGG